MAVFIKVFFVSFFTLFCVTPMAHMIYEPNDIPLLDNRFRIDPATEQVTFILNHSQGKQEVVLVQPDGSKLYEKRHPETVSWVSSETQNIITVEKPMAGPWQAIAQLDGNNRIKIISDVELKVSRLPLKLYAGEYITTHATLYADNELMSNATYLEDAKLSVTLINDEDDNKQVSFYKDDGKLYDELPFDGKLTAHIYVDLPPARYLLNISTQNDVFLRSVNKDAVVFIRPITYNIKNIEENTLPSERNEDSQNTQITFYTDISEIELNSISINGAIKDASGNTIEQILIHSLGNISDSGAFSIKYKLPYGSYFISGKAYATTLDGRELELQLAESTFELVAPFVMPEITPEEALPKDSESTEDLNEQPSSMFSNLWVLISIGVIILLLLMAVIFFIVKRKKKKAKEAMEQTEELSIEELQPMPIDLTESK